jgi:hypothetical protein
MLPPPWLLTLLSSSAVGLGGGSGASGPVTKISDMLKELAPMLLRAATRSWYLQPARSKLQLVLSAGPW